MGHLRLQHGPVADRNDRIGAAPRRLALAVAALLALAVPAGTAHAQGAVRSVHGDWQIRCDTPPGAQAEQCALIQSVVAGCV